MSDTFERFEMHGDPLAWVEHRDGIAWMHAPRPRRWHRCKVQTRAWTGRLGYVERCACGAIRLHWDGLWMERNSSKGSPMEYRGELAIRRPLGNKVALGAFAAMDDHFAQHMLEKVPGGVLVERTELGGEWRER